MTVPSACRGKYENQAVPTRKYEVHYSHLPRRNALQAFK